MSWLYFLMPVLILKISSKMQAKSMNFTNEEAWTIIL